MAVSLTWHDIMVILAHSCTKDEKLCMQWPGNTHPLLATHPHQIHQVGGDAIPEHDPNRDCEDRVGQARIRHYWSIRRNEKVEAYKL